MRTKTITLIGALALIVYACGSSDTTTTTKRAAPETEATVATEAAETTEAPASTEAPATTAEETTTTVEDVDVALEAAMAAAGTYAGTWTNTTFGSTGAASMTMTVTEAGDVSMDWDLGGGVFGFGDPDGENQGLNVADLADGEMVSTTLFGDMQVTVSTDFTRLTLDAEDVPAAGIQAFRALATWSADGSITGTYEVEFEGGGDPAVGTFELTRG